MSLTVLAVFAHPDDEGFGCGGTLAALAAGGHRVTLVCATNGDVGEISDPELATPETLWQVRQRELRTAMGRHWHRGRALPELPRLRHGGMGGQQPPVQSVPGPGGSGGGAGGGGYPGGAARRGHHPRPHWRIRPSRPRDHLPSHRVGGGTVPRRRAATVLPMLPPQRLSADVAGNGGSRHPARLSPPTTSKRWGRRTRKSPQSAGWTPTLR